MPNEQADTRGDGQMPRGLAIMPQAPAEMAVLSDDPTTVLERASAIANALMSIAKKTPALIMRRGERQHLRCELWTTMGAMLKVFPHVVETHRLDREGEIAYEARVRLVHLPTGNVVGEADAMASDAERIKRREGGEWIAPPWSGNEYSVRSMAQTRAIGKAFRASFSWIPTLAGFDPTPAEEMPPHEDEGGAPASAPPSSPRRDARRMKSKFAGECACGARIPKGADIDYADKRVVGCATCGFTGEEPTRAEAEDAAPPAPVGTITTPGESSPATTTGLPRERAMALFRELRIENGARRAFASLALGVADADASALSDAQWATIAAALEGDRRKRAMTIASLRDRITKTKAKEADTIRVAIDADEDCATSLDDLGSAGLDRVKAFLDEARA